MAKSNAPAITAEDAADTSARPIEANPDIHERIQNVSDRLLSYAGLGVKVAGVAVAVSAAINGDVNGLMQSLAMYAGGAGIQVAMDNLVANKANEAVAEAVTGDPEDGKQTSMLSRDSGKAFVNKINPVETFREVATIAKQAGRKLTRSLGLG